MNRTPRSRRPDARPTFRLLLAAALAFAASAPATTIAVDTGIDEQNVSNGNCTLREAISAAEANLAIDLCPAGSQVETDVVLLLETPHAWSAGFAFVSGGGPLVLRGPGAALRSAGGGAVVVVDPPFALRFLRLLDGADLTLENVEVREGDATTDQSFAAGGALLVAGLSDVKLTLRDVRLAGNASPVGGALYFETSSGCVGCRLRIERSVFSQNVAERAGGGGTVAGGGMFLQIRGDTTATIVDSAFEWNEVRSDFAGNVPTGGGFYAGLSDDASLTVRRSVIYANSAIGAAGVSAVAGGASIWPFGETTLVMEDVYFDSNLIVGPAPGAWPATALDVHSGFSGGFALDRLSFFGNDWSEDGVDLRLEHSAPTGASARNILLAAGARRGAEVRNWGAGEIALSHWTVTQHVERGVHLYRNPGSGALTFDNSIVWMNGTEVVPEGAPAVDPGNNLIGVDPLFEAPFLGGFRLTALSPAVDLGDAAASGTRIDLVHAPRSVGGAPDAGAYEYDGLFADGFESGDTGAWYATVP